MIKRVTAKSSPFFIRKSFFNVPRSSSLGRTVYTAEEFCRYFPLLICHMEAPPCRLDVPEYLNIIITFKPEFAKKYLMYWQVCPAFKTEMDVLAYLAILKSHNPVTVFENLAITLQEDQLR